MQRLIIVFIVCLIFNVSAFASENQNPAEKMSAEQIQKLDSLNHAMESLDKLGKLADSMTRQKKSDCLKAFGNQDFCQCLSDNLPVPVSFELYVTIVTTPKDKLGYSELDQENKDIVDVTINAREKCVKKQTTKR
jgi:hypothetical protein